MRQKINRVTSFTKDIPYMAKVYLLFAMNLPL
jgi:hypothetical protein